MKKPDFTRLWNAFPDHAKYPTLKDLYKWLGGAAERNIYVPGFGPNGNTCASRLSVAFNKAGVPIDTNIAGAGETVGTSDGSRIIYRVSTFRSYLLKTLGKPQIDGARPFDDQFLGTRGIIAFSVNWNDATGHIALFDGARYREPEHDNYATYVNSVDPSIKTTVGEFWSFA